MTQPLTTQYMGILLPTIEISNNYPELLNTAFNTVDSHNHNATGLGLTEKSINWTDFDVNSNSLYNISSLSFTPQTATPAGLFGLYFLNGNAGIDLFFKNSAANIQITNQGAIAFLEPVNGFDGNFNISDASVVYTAATNTYQFNIGENLGNIRASTMVFLETITANSLLITAIQPFTITSTGFFYDNGSILCGSGATNLRILFETTDIANPINVSNNPRLLTTVQRFQNVQTIPNVYFRQTRYVLNPLNAFINLAAEAPADTCLITLIHGNFVSNFESFQDLQTPAEETYAQNTTSYIHQTGSICEITPTFLDPVDPHIGTIELYAYFKSIQGFTNPLMVAAQKIFNGSVIVKDPSVNPQISFIKEYHGFDPAPNMSAAGDMVFSAYYLIQVIDLNTQLAINNWTLRCRI